MMNVREIQSDGVRYYTYTFVNDNDIPLVDHNFNLNLDCDCFYVPTAPVAATTDAAQFHQAGHGQRPPYQIHPGQMYGQHAQQQHFYQFTYGK